MGMNSQLSHSVYRFPASCHVLLLDPAPQGEGVDGGWGKALVSKGLSAADSEWGAQQSLLGSVSGR